LALFTVFKPYLLWLFVAANIMVIIFGLSTALGLRGLSLSILDGSGWGFMSHLLRQVSAKASLPGFLAAGLVMGLIPCGMVYGVLVTAATRVSWQQGGGMMLAFGLGTIPAMLAYGQLATAFTAVAGSVFVRIMGLAVALMGAGGVIKTLILLGLLPPLSIW
jgi:sulfite exporter TauE/SafE